MASLVYTNAFLWVNGKDLSSYGVTISPNYGSETVDGTTFGQTTRIMKGGLKTWSFNMDFLYDNTTGGPEATLWSLVGTTACFEWRPVNACSTVINPSYFGIGTISALNSGGSVGAMLKSTATMISAGTLSRASSS